MELVDDFFCLFLALLNKMKTLGESKVSGVNQENEGGRWVEDFAVLPQGFGTFHYSFRERGGAFSARGSWVLLEV